MWLERTHREPESRSSDRLDDGCCDTCDVGREDFEILVLKADSEAVVWTTDVLDDEGAARCLAGKWMCESRIALSDVGVDGRLYRRSLREPKHCGQRRSRCRSRWSRSMTNSPFLCHEQGSFHSGVTTLCYRSQCVQAATSGRSEQRKSGVS